MSILKTLVPAAAIACSAFAAPGVVMFVKKEGAPVLTPVE